MRLSERALVLASRLLISGSQVRALVRPPNFLIDQAVGPVALAMMVAKKSINGYKLFRVDFRRTTATHTVETVALRTADVESCERRA